MVIARRELNWAAKRGQADEAAGDGSGDGAPQPAKAAG
jgi:hypothetical protein